MNKYVSAISSNIIYFFISTFFFLIITPISIHLMGAELFGLWSILNAIIFLTGVGTLGMGAIVTKFVGEMHEHEAPYQRYSSEVVSAGILIMLPMSAITISILVSLRHFITSNLGVDSSLQEQFNIALLLVAGTILPQFLSRIPQGFLLSQYKTGLVRRIETTYSVLLWGGAVLIVSYEKSLMLISLWCFLDAILLLGMYIFALHRILNFTFCVNPALVKRMLGFSGFMFIESFAITLFQQMDRVIVGFVLGPALAGIYTAGTSIGLRMSIVTGQVTEVMIPYASLKDSADNHLRLFIVFRKLSKYISHLVAILGGTLILWMNEILSLWISPEYGSSYSNIFRLFILGYGFLSLSRPAHQTLTGMGKVNATSLIYSLSTISMLTGLYFLSSRFGFLGAALANSVPALLIIMNFYAYKKLNGRIDLREILVDLKWGVLLPVLVFLLILLEPVFWIKFLTTIVLVSLVVMLLLKDDWARLWLISKLRSLVNRLFSYA